VLRNVHIWLLPYLRSRLARRAAVGGGGRFHLVFSFVDHFEPLWSTDDEKTGLERVSRWIERYESAAAGIRDGDGRPPRHTYFYPLDAYRESQVALLAEHCRRGFGEIEFHLHHENDTPERFVETMERYKRVFAERGLLGRDADGAPRYAFVHGNWALDNSLPGGRFCGLDNELTLLAETGCYADFTLPSAPSAAQTRTINAIYYAIDDPDRPKSHDTGVPVRVNGAPPPGGAHLMIVQGPLGLDWKRRSRGFLPRIENGELTSVRTSSPRRWRMWIGAAIAVRGRPEWVFVKAFAHGCEVRSFARLFEQGDFERLHADLESVRAERGDFDVHFVTAREQYNIIKAAEAGRSGNPNDYRDFCIGPPPMGRAL